MKIFEDWLIESHPSTWQGDGHYHYAGGHYKNKDDYYEYNPGRKEAEVKSACIKRLMSYFNKFKMKLEKTGKVKTYARYKVPFTIGENTFYVVFADEKRSLKMLGYPDFDGNRSLLKGLYLVCKFMGFEGEGTTSFSVKEGTEPCVPVSTESLNEIGKLLMDMKDEQSSEEATKKFITKIKALDAKYDIDDKDNSCWRDCYIRVDWSKKKK